MKLISGNIESSVKPIMEETDGGKKTFISGIFMQADQPNRNNRIYPKKILATAVEKYINEQVKTGRAVGECGHPSDATINYDRVSHRITDLYWEGKNVMGKALVLNTPMGQIVKGLLEGGCQLGVSSRGMGSVEEDFNGVSVVGEDYLINTVDIVQDPSAPSAFVNGIMEGVDFFIDKKTGRIHAEKVDALQKKFRKMSLKQIAECQTTEFEKFLQSIS